MSAVNNNGAFRQFNFVAVSAFTAFASANPNRRFVGSVPCVARDRVAIDVHIPISQSISPIVC